MGRGRIQTGPMPALSPLAATDLELLFQDRDVVAVNKPTGLLSVPGRGPANQDCVQFRLALLFPAVYPAHRLDMATSGVLLFALRRSAERELHRQFRERLTAKRYVARVHGHLRQDEGEIDLPLLSIMAEGRSRVDAAGKPALTAYRVLSRDPDDSTLLELWPRTGRSHQLRVHLQALGHPILGDRFYAPAEVVARSDRLLLHAAELSFNQPYSNIRLCISAPVPFA